MGLFKDLLGMAMGHHGNGGGGYYNKRGRYQRNDFPLDYDNQPSNTATIACFKCQASHDVNARFCQQCGTSLVGTECTGCGAKLTATTKFCSQCGKSTA